MPNLRAAMHLDTVFTFADRNVATVFPTIVKHDPFRLAAAQRQASRGRGDRRGLAPIRRRLRGGPRAAGAARVIETGGDVYASERQQWDSGNNAVASSRAGLHL
jgi:arginine deiminase